MLRSSTRKLASVRGFHSSMRALAAKPVLQKKASVPKYKLKESTKPRKTTGVGKNFSDYVNKQKLEKFAPELPDVPNFEGDAIQENIVVKYNEAQMKKLIISGSFHDDHHRELFRTPITLVTKDTKYMEEFIQKSINSDSKSNRICLLGENGIGKSTLLAQTQAMITNLGNGLIIPIPYAKQLVDGRNDFALDNQTKLYIQPMYLKRFITRILDVNEKVLAKVPLSKEHSFEGNSKNRSLIKVNNRKHSLYDLVKLSVAPRNRGKQLDAVFEELVTQDKVPVYLTVENFSALTGNGKTVYRDSSNSHLHVERFQIGKLIFQFASGELSFKKGGVILVTSSDDKPSQTLLAGLGKMTPDVYTPERYYDRELASRLKTVQPYELNRFSKENVSSLCESLIKADVFKNAEVDQGFETVVNQKYFLSGNGNPGELIKSVVMFN